MTSSVFLGLDIGTQSVKCAICIQGNEFDVIQTGQSSALKVHTVPAIRGSAEQDPADWVTAVKEAVKDAIKNDISIASRIKAIGVSGQQHGLVALGKNGSPLRPCMLWCDTRGADEANEISTFAGVHIPAGYTSPKMLWMLRNEPALFDSTEQFMLPHDFINFYLAGGLLGTHSSMHGFEYKYSMECGDASGTGLFDVPSRSLDRRVMDFIHPTLHNKLPSSLASPGDCIGRVHPLVLAELFESVTDSGISFEHDVLISAGSGDNAMTLLGASCLRVLPPQRESDPLPPPLLISLGTSGTIMTASDTAPEDPAGTVSCLADATGRWMPLICVQNCARVPEEVITAFCPPGESCSETTERIVSAAAKESVGSEGVLVLPYFSEGGERTPDWPHACGGVLGLRHGHLQRPSLLYRAAVEGVTCALLRGFRRMQELCRYETGGTRREVLVVGGGAHSDLWLQVIADMFELPVTTLPPHLSGHVGALGAVAQCLAVYHSVAVGSVPIRVQPGCTDNIVDCRRYTPTASAEKILQYRAIYEKHVSITNLIFSVGHVYGS